MSNKRLFVLTSGMLSMTLIGISLSGEPGLWAAFIGYLTGIFNGQWLKRDARKIINRDLQEALVTYYKSLFARLGMVTLLVATVGTFVPGWLIYLAGGLALGIVLPLAASILKQTSTKGGEH